MDELDRRLRAIAAESLDREIAAVRVDDDLAAVRARATRRPVPAASASRSWVRLAVAATLVLFVGGAVALLATRDSGEEVVAPPPTEVPASTTLPPAPSTTWPSTTSIPVDTFATARVDPGVVDPGAAVTVWPASAVAPKCPGSATVYVDGARPGTAPFGWIEDGESSFVAAPLVERDLASCEMEVSADARVVTIPHDLAPGTYRICIDEDASASGCGIVVVVDGGVVTSTTVVPATTTTSLPPTPATLPVAYFERVSVDLPPYFELRQVADDGSGTSTLADAEVEQLLRREVTTGVGGIVRLSPEEQPYGRCDNRRVVAVDATSVAPELVGPVRSLAATGDGVVVVGVDVCPDGATWGDPGTRFELRRIDLATGTTTVLHVREPGDGDTFFEDRDVVYAGGEFLVESVSPDGAWVAVAEPYTTEDLRHHVFSAETAGDPIELGSACPDPRDLVGPPQFVGDGRVVVARECAPVDDEVGGLIVELVSLETREPLWSVEVEGVAIDSYSRTVSLDAAEVEGRVWALVSGSAGVEQPIEAAVVTEGTELPLPGGAIVAFDPRELIEPWDPYP